MGQNMQNDAPMSDWDQQAAADSSLPSIRRRQLLRSAGVAGPLIATLPSGAALANASAVQCVIAEQQTDRVEPDGRVFALDKYVRVMGAVESWQLKPSGGSPAVAVRIYYLPATSTGLDFDVRVYGDLRPDSKELGDWFDTADATTSTPLKSRDAAFLYEYKVANTVPEKSDVSFIEGDLAPADCEVETLDWTGSPFGDKPSSPEHCFFPMAVQVAPQQPGNVPLTYSCLCSLDPTNPACDIMMPNA
jgi:hypothetical protein